LEVAARGRRKRLLQRESDEFRVGDVSIGEAAVQFVHRLGLARTEGPVDPDQHIRILCASADRQNDLHSEAALWARPQFEASPVCTDDPRDDREPEPGTVGLPVPRAPGAALKRLDQGRQRRGVDDAPRVLHAQPHPVR
jgi:hypothetical protein